MRPTKVLYIAGELTFGGYQRQLRLLLSQLEGSPIDPILAVWRHDPDQEMAQSFDSLGVPLYPVPRPSSAGARVAGLCALARRVAPKYVHSYCFYTNFPAWCAARAVGAAGVLGSFRSDYHNEVRTAGAVRGRLSASLPRDAIANSVATAVAIRAARTPWKPARIWSVCNAVDTDAFRPVERTAERDVVLIGIGRLSAEKRWPWLLERLRALPDNVPEWTFRICGEGPERKRIEAATAACGLQHRVQLLGSQPNIEQHLQAADILLLGSEYEGSPNVVAEAQSCGLPVVATAVGDVEQIISTGTTGFAVPVADAAGFERRLAELLADEGLRHRMGGNGRQRMLEQRSPATLLRETLAAYRCAGWEIA